VIALYNPASKARPHQLAAGVSIFFWVFAGGDKGRRSTVVLFVRNSRNTETQVIVTSWAEGDPAGRYAHACHYWRRGKRLIPERTGPGYIRLAAERGICAMSEPTVPPP